MCRHQAKECGGRSRKAAFARRNCYPQVAMLELTAGMCRPVRPAAGCLSLPGTAVPGYRLFRSGSTSSGQALRDCFAAARK